MKIVRKPQYIYSQTPKQKVSSVSPPTTNCSYLVVQKNKNFYDFLRQHHSPLN